MQVTAPSGTQSDVVQEDKVQRGHKLGGVGCFSSASFNFGNLGHPSSHRSPMPEAVLAI